MYLGVYHPVFFQDAYGSESGFLFLGVVLSIPIVALFVITCGNLTKIPTILYQTKNNTYKADKNTKNKFLKNQNCHSLYIFISLVLISVLIYTFIDVSIFILLLPIPVFIMITNIFKHQTKYKNSNFLYIPLLFIYSTDDNHQIKHKLKTILKNYVHPSLYLFISFGFGLLAVFIINHLTKDVSYIWSLLPLPFALITIAGVLKYKKPEMRLWFFALVFSAMLMIFHGSENNILDKELIGLIAGFCIGIMLTSIGASLGRAFNEGTNKKLNKI